MPSEQALQVSGLRAGYGSVEVVFGVELHVEPGEIVVLVGRNGVGKTTSLGAIVGLRYGVTGGTVRVGNIDVSRRTPNQIVSQGLKLVPEGRRIFGRMTVIENLRLGAFLRRRSRVFGFRLAASVGKLFPALLSYQHSFVSTLSGGQQQMVAVGQALMT